MKHSMFGAELFAMNEQAIGNMSLSDLRLLITKIVDEQLQKRRWPGQITGESVEEVLEAMGHDLWTPPPDAKSSVEILEKIGSDRHSLTLIGRYLVPQ